ncbi:SAGA histone acetylase and TREX-2 complexes component [Cerrena zonata]|uniref:Transcription and mRNA export factor SUS1 n=1 Tax=Cerrena zonata TaxID=2478898 RepID=A0AAW0FJN2_9APHY
MTQHQEELDAIKSQIQEHLISSGNYDLISKQLKLQLYESGWFDKVSQVANWELKERSENDQNINFDQLFSSLKPKAEEIVPQEIKEETLQKLKVYLDDVIQ